MRPSLQGLRRWLPVLAAILVVGCKVTPDDIDYWKRTQKGPGKIVAVMLAERYPLELRTQAALALVEMERNDVDGVGELQTGLDQVQSRSTEEVQQLVAGMVEPLQSMMRGEGEANANPELGPPPLQTRAKDAAYVLIPYADDATKTQLMRAVVSWYAVDFANRNLSGNYSAEQVVRSLGAPAARELVEAMNAHLGEQALIKVAELIGQIGDDETKRVAGTRLIEIEREMEGDEFVNWIKGKILEQAAASGREYSDAAALGAAINNRDRIIVEGALPAMRHLASQENLRARLLELAQTRPPGDASPADAAVINQRRYTALLALEGNVQEQHLDTLLNIALDETDDIQVRDHAFDRVGDVNSARALPRLWPLLENEDNDTIKKRLRWRAGELILAIGGAGVVPEFFQRLPDAREVEYEPEELAGYAQRMSQMTPPPTDVVERHLSDSHWYGRVIALRFIERRGGQADVSKLQRLAGDQTACVGPSWGPREIPTVGKVAEDAMANLRERLEQPSDDGGESAMAADSSAMESEMGSTETSAME